MYSFVLQGDVPILVEPTDRIKLSLDADICEQRGISDKVSKTFCLYKGKHMYNCKQ